MIKGAPLPAIWNRVGVGANLEGIEPFQVFTLAIENAYVRAKEFVGRADQKIAVESADIDGPMRRIVNRIDVSHRVPFVSEADDLRDVVDRAHRIRCVADGDQLGARGDLAR